MIKWEKSHFIHLTVMGRTALCECLEDSMALTAQKTAYKTLFYLKAQQFGLQWVPECKLCRVVEAILFFGKKMLFYLVIELIEISKFYLVLHSWLPLRFRSYVRPSRCVTRILNKFPQDMTSGGTRTQLIYYRSLTIRYLCPRINTELFREWWA